MTSNVSGSERREVRMSTSTAVQPPIAASSSSTGVKSAPSPVPMLSWPPRSLLAVYLLFPIRSSVCHDAPNHSSCWPPCHTPRCYTRCPARARGAWQNEPVAAGLEGGGPSVTARHVAAHRLCFTRVPAPYGDPAADDALAADVAAGREAPLNRMHDYLAARTAFFDRIVVAAIGRGLRQIVVGAAGYDGRALRYAKPGVRWFEVDDPATQRDKRARLKRLGLKAPRVQFVEADFTQDPVAERLLAAGLDPAASGLLPVGRGGDGGAGQVGARRRRGRSPARPQRMADHARRGFRRSPGGRTPATAFGRPARGQRRPQSRRQPQSRRHS